MFFCVFLLLDRHLLRTAVSLRAIEQDMAINVMQTQKPTPMVKGN